MNEAFHRDPAGPGFILPLQEQINEIREELRTQKLRSSQTVRVTEVRGEGTTLEATPDTAPQSSSRQVWL